MNKRSLLWLFAVIFLLIAIPNVKATVSLMNLTNLTINESDTLIYNLPINTTNINGTLHCSVNLTPKPNGQYSIVQNNNNCTFYFMPTYEDAGTYVAIFNVSDNNSQDSKSINIYVLNVNRAPHFTTVPVTQGYVNETYHYDVNAYDDDGDALIYWLEKAPEGMTINSTTGLITWLPQQAGTYTVIVKVTDGTIAVNQTYTLKIIKKQYLKLERAKVKVDGDSETLSDGESFKVKPGSKIEFSFKVRNVHPDKLDIEDVYVAVYIKGIDGEDEDDIYEESDETDLDYRDYETLDVNLDIPLQVKKGSYDVIVYIYGTDESNLDIVDVHNYTLRVDKDRYAVYLKNFNIFPDKITCSGNAELSGKIYNIGRNDLDLMVTVTNDELGLNYQRSISLDNNPFDEDNDYYLSVPITVSHAKQDKDYQINLRIRDEDGHININKMYTLSVKKCEEQTSEEETENKEENKETEKSSQKSEIEVKVGEVTNQSIQNTTSESSGSEKEIIYYEQSFTDSPLFITMLAGIFGLLIVLVVVIIVLLTK